MSWEPSAGFLDVDGAMVQALLQGVLALISVSRCPVCGANHEGAAGPPGVGLRPDALPDFCGRCRTELALPSGGLHGVLGVTPEATTATPLTWRALGPYDGAFRRLLLRQRQAPSPAVLAVLARALVPQSSALGNAGSGGLVFVPIPSWKRRANPLVEQLGRALAKAPGVLLLPLLGRSRPTVGQHHLDRRLRLVNQLGSFRLDQARRTELPRCPRRSLWLLDDILTTGATALAAAQALEAAGLAVAGLCSLARTPEPRCGNAVPYYPPVAEATGRDSSVGRAGD